MSRKELIQIPFLNGQMINNGGDNHIGANARYQELDLGFDFKAHRFLPNVYNRLDWDPDNEPSRRVVVIIATRDIQAGTEVLTTYRERIL